MHCISGILKCLVMTSLYVITMCNVYCYIGGFIHERPYKQGVVGYYLRITVWLECGSLSAKVC